MPITIEADGKTIEFDDNFYALTDEEQGDLVYNALNSADFTEDELRKNPNWINNSRTMYEFNEGESAPADMSDDELAEYGLSFMGWFNYNLPKMALEAGQLTQGTDEQKQAFLYLMNRYDQKDITLAGTGRFFKGVLSDPSTYFGLATLGFGTAASAATKAGTKEGVKAALKASIGSGIKIGAAEGAAYGAADNALRQSIRIQGGVQDDFDFGESAKSAALGATIGAPLGGLGGAVSGAIAGRSARSSDGVVDDLGDTADNLTPDGQAQRVADETQEELFTAEELAPRTQVEAARAQTAAIESAASIVRTANKGKGEVLETAAEEVARRIETNGLDDPTKMQQTFDVLFNSLDATLAQLRKNKTASEALVPLVRRIATGLVDDPEMAADALRNSGTMEQFISRSVATSSVLNALEKEVVRVTDKISKVTDPDVRAQMEADELAPVVDALEMAEQVHKEFGTQFGVALKSRQYADMNPVLNLAQLKNLKRQGVSMTEAVQMARRAAEEVGVDPDLTARPTTFGKIIRTVVEYRANALLSGPVTQEINILSTMANLYLRPFFELAGTPFMRNGSEVRRAAVARYIGMHNTMLGSLRAAQKAFKEEKAILSSSRKFDLDEDAAISAEYWDIDPDSVKGKSLNKLGSIVRLVSRSMLFTDEFFKQMAYKGEIVADATLEAQARKLNRADTKKLIDEKLEKAFGSKGNALVEAAQTRAEEVTFTNKFDPTAPYAGEKLAAEIETLIKQVPVLRLFQPFYRTPVRLMDLGFRMSGLGLTTKLFGMQNKFYDDLVGKRGPRNAAIARTQLTYAVSALGLTAYAVSNGQMTGGLGTKKDYKRIREQSEQTPPYSIKVNGKWYSYQRFEPFATPLKIMADMVEGMERIDYKDAQGIYSVAGSRMTDIVAALTGSIARSTTNPTFMEGFDQFITLLTDGFGGDPEAAGRFGKQFGRSFVPNLFQKIANTIEPEIRETNTLWDSFGAPLKLSGTPRRDIYGREVERDPMTGFWLFTGFEGDDDPIRTEVNDVMQKAEASIDFPSARSFMSGVDLSKELTEDGSTTLYDKYKELSGTIRHPESGLTLREALAKTISDPEYTNRGAGSYLVRGGRFTKLQDVFSDYHKEALDELIKTDKNANRLFRRDKRMKGIAEASVDELLQ